MDTVEPLQPRVRDFLQFIAAHPAPPLDEDTLAAARAGVVEAQSGCVTVPSVSMHRRTIAGLSAYIYRPAGVTGLLPAVVYFHGGGWVFCDHPVECGVLLSSPHTLPNAERISLARLALFRG